MYKMEYKSKIGPIVLLSDGTYLIGLYFKDLFEKLKHNEIYEEKNNEVFNDTIKWLDEYFNGINPSFIPKIKFTNLTPFKSLVYKCIQEIPYGKTITYSDIAKRIASLKGIKKMSNQAVGVAVGSNPICIIVPCHRVIGVNNNLVGYGGGIYKKQELLKLEGNDITKFYIPKKGNKL